MTEESILVVECASLSSRSIQKRPVSLRSSTMRFSGPCLISCRQSSEPILPEAPVTKIVLLQSQRVRPTVSTSTAWRPSKSAISTGRGCICTLPLMSVCIAGIIVAVHPAAAHCFCSSATSLPRKVCDSSMTSSIWCLLIRRSMCFVVPRTETPPVERPTRFRSCCLAIMPTTIRFSFCEISD